MPMRGPPTLMLAIVLAYAGWAGIASPAVAQKSQYAFTVINRTDAPIDYFYFSACGANDWRADRLGRKESIEQGASRRFNMHDGNADCCRDMRAKLAHGGSRQKLGVDVCRETQWVVQ